MQMFLKVTSTGKLLKHQRVKNMLGMRRVLILETQAFDNIADGTIDSFEVKDARILASWVTLLRLTISLLQEELRKMVQQANI